MNDHFPYDIAMLIFLALLAAAVFLHAIRLTRCKHPPMWIAKGVHRWLAHRGACAMKGWIRVGSQHVDMCAKCGRIMKSEVSEWGPWGPVEWL